MDWSTESETPLGSAAQLLHKLEQAHLARHHHSRTTYPIAHRQLCGHCACSRSHGCWLTNSSSRSSNNWQTLGSFWRMVPAALSAEDLARDSTPAAPSAADESAAAAAAPAAFYAAQQHCMLSGLQPTAVGWYTAGQSPLTLEFPTAALERQWLQHWDAGRHHRDRTAAWLYLAMDVPGLLAMIVAGTVRPDTWNASVAGCATMTITTTMVLVGHLLLLSLLPPAAYTAMRGPIIAAVRLLYTASAVLRGLQECSTVTKWVDGVELESPVSALLWRTGIIALLWHGAAFRLPFKQQLYIQSFAAMAYALFLPEAVCNSLAGVDRGESTVLAAHSVLQAVQCVWGVLSVLVSGQAAELQDGASGAAVDGGASGSSSAGAPGAAAAATGAAAAAVAPDVQAVCLSTVRWWQVLIGHVLLSTILYCVEAADRRHWFLKHLANPQQEQEQQQGTDSLHHPESAGRVR